MQFWWVFHIVGTYGSLLGLWEIIELSWGLECFEWWIVWINCLLLWREDVQLLLSSSHLSTWGRSYHWFGRELVLTNDSSRFHAFAVLEVAKVFLWFPLYFDLLWFNLSFSVGSWVCFDFIATLATNEFLYKRWNAVDSSEISLIFDTLIIITQAHLLIVWKSCISICINRTFQRFPARCIKLPHWGCMFCV